MPLRHNYRRNDVVQLIVAALFLATAAGCSPQVRPPIPDQSGGAQSAAATLNIVVVGEPQIAATLARTWQAEGRGDAAVTEISTEQWIAKKFAVDANVDVVVFPASYQAELIAAGKILEIPNEIWNGPDIGKNELLTHYRTTLARFGNKVYAVQLGGPQLMLVYRSDILEALGAKPPATWAELDAIAERLASAGELTDSAGNRLPTIVAQPMGDAWPAHILLARVAGAISGHGRLSTVVNVETLEPLIATAPFVEAATQIAAIERLRAATGAGEPYADPAAVFRAVVDGDAAIGITWPSAQFADRPTSATPRIRVMRLPAAPQWFDQSSGTWKDAGPDDPTQIDYLGFAGLVAGISKSSLHASESFDFVAWLTSKRTSLQIATESGQVGPFRASQLSDPLRWTGQAISPQAAEQFTNVIRATHESRLVFTFPRLKGQSEYLRELAAAVRSVAAGSTSAESALDQAAKTWTTLTTTHGGPEAQSEFLRKAEGF